MKQIKARDLEIIEQEKQEEQANEANLAQSIADLKIQNTKKDQRIPDLSQTIADLNVQIQQLKGGK